MATRTTPRSQANEILDREELLGLLSVAAKKGHVGAMRLLLEELRRDDHDKPEEAPSVIDELASKRSRVS